MKTRLDKPRLSIHYRRLTVRQQLNRSVTANSGNVTVSKRLMRIQAAQGAAAEF